MKTTYTIRIQGVGGCCGHQYRKRSPMEAVKEMVEQFLPGAEVKRLYKKCVDHSIQRLAQSTDGDGRLYLYEIIE